MDDAEPIVIASAVVVPDDNPTPDTTSRPKRRAESGSPETNKRARPDPSSARRRTGLEEEKKRGKRLFGALLGTIGKFQKDSTTARARTNAVKRKEVEAKLQEKLKAQSEELDVRRRREDDDFNLRRRVESREFEQRVIRHANLIAQANMLATKTTPKLFYMPWKPLPSEEETIRAQIEAAERTVSDAEIAFRQLRERDEEELRAASGEGAEVGEAAVAEQQDISTQSPPRDDVAEVADNGDEVDQQKPSHADEQADGADGNRVAEDGSGERRNSDIGDVTDIMEEGEDTVIY